MNLATAIQIIQFLRTLAPLVPEIYGAIQKTFGNAPGMVKFNAFVDMVRSYMPVVDELKPFVAVLEQAVPHLQVLVTKYHELVTAPNAASNAIASGPVPAPNAS